MDYRELGRTGVKVSSLCLGTMTFGEQNSETEGHAQMDHALDCGINIFDAAEIYPIPPKPETQGRTESIIGSWLASRKCRDKVMIATKVAGRGKMVWLRKDVPKTRQSKAQVEEAIEGSLRRLKTDYVDLYQLHWPDRPMRIFEGLDYLHKTGDGYPIDEILTTLGRLVADGKVRFVGLSNETPCGLMSSRQPSSTGCLARFRFRTHSTWSIVRSRSDCRRFSTGSRSVCSAIHRSVRAISAANMKAARCRPARASCCSTGSGATRRGMVPAISAYTSLARRHGLDPAQMAITFAASRPFMTSVIIGATTMEQLKTDIAAAKLKLSDDVLEDIEQIHLDYPNPCP